MGEPVIDNSVRISKISYAAICLYVSQTFKYFFFARVVELLRLAFVYRGLGVLFVCVGRPAAVAGPISASIYEST